MSNQGDISHQSETPVEPPEDTDELRQPIFTGTAEEKQQQYSDWREEWFRITQQREILQDGMNKPGRPK